MSSSSSKKKQTLVHLKNVFMSDVIPGDMVIWRGAEDGESGITELIVSTTRPHNRESPLGTESHLMWVTITSIVVDASCQRDIGILEKHAWIVNVSRVSDVFRYI